MERVHFVLVCEGSSDENLVPHLRELLVQCGAQSATGAAPDFARLRGRVRRDVRSRVRAALILESNANLLFVHRDADSTDDRRCREEIDQAIRATEYDGEWIAIVPVQETEAWLLLDEMAIRRAAGRPNGRTDLGLPRPNAVELVSRAKEKLRAALLTASELAGRRREGFSRKFPTVRGRLLRELRTGGPLEGVPAWVRLKLDVSALFAEREQ